MTNFEKIKAMSAEKFADTMVDFISCGYCPAADMCEDSRDKSCLEILTEWLESEVEEDG